MKHEKVEDSAETNTGKQKGSSSVPPAMLSENRPTNEHSRSHAAHLEEGKQDAHTKPAGNLRQGSYPTGRKQP